MRKRCVLGDMGKRHKSKDSKKQVVEKQEEAEEETINEENQQVNIHVKENNDVDLPEEIINKIEPVLEIQIDRFLLQAPFTEVKKVLVDDEHYFIKILLDFVPFYFNKINEQISITSEKIIELIRNMILNKIEERYQVSSNIYYSLQGDFISHELNHFLESLTHYELPSLIISPKTFAQKAEIRTPTLKKILEQTFKKNLDEMDEIKPKLADNLTTKRRDIFKQLHPLEKDNEILGILLSEWENPGEIILPINKNLEESDNNPPPSSSSDQTITLRPFTIDRDCIRKEAETFQSILCSNNILDKTCEKLKEFKSYENLKSENIPNVKDSFLISKQENVRRYRIFSDNLEKFLFDDDDSFVKQIPSCTLGIRVITKSQMHLLYDLKKDELDRISKQSQSSSQDVIENLERDIKFIKQVLHKWDKRTKISKRNCVNYLTLCTRETARKDMKNDEILLFRSKLADLYLYIYENEQEFQNYLKKQLKTHKNLLRLGISLGVWSSFDQQKLLDELNSYSDRLDQIPMDQFPSFENSRKFCKNLSKYSQLISKINEIENNEIKVPQLELRVAKINKKFVDNLLVNYEDELSSINNNNKSSSSKKNKEKIQTIENQISNLQSLSKDWKSKSKWSKERKNSVVFTLPKTTSLAKLSKEEKHCLSSLGKSKSSSTFKKLESLKLKSKQFEKSLRDSYDELFHFYEEKIILLRDIEQKNSHIYSAPNLQIHKNSISFILYDLIASSKVTVENVSHVVDIWQILQKYKPQSELEEYYSNQLKDFPVEIEKIKSNDNINNAPIAANAQHSEKEKSESTTENNNNNAIITQKDVTASNNVVTSSSSAATGKKGKHKHSLIDNEIHGLLLITSGFESIHKKDQSGNSNKNNNLSFVLNSQEQIELLDFLAYMQGNSNFNSKLAEILENDSIPFGISSDAMEYCRTFTFKSRHLDCLHPYTIKLQNAWTKANSNEINDENIHKRDKITLKELGILRTMERWGKDLIRVFQLFKKDENNENHPMYQILSNSISAHNTLRSIYSSIQDSINNDKTFQSGDLLLVVWNRKVKTMQGNRPPTAFSFLMSFTKYEHTAVIYRNLNSDVGPIGEPRLSHMYRQYHDSEITLEDLSSSDIFRIWTPALIKDKPIRARLLEKFGDSWEQIIQDRYYSIESDLHSSKQGTLGGITNPLSRVMNIGTAAVLPWTRMRRTNMDFDKIKSNLYEDDPKTDLQMTCSEFAAKSAIAAILELDEQLIHELGDIKQGSHIFTLPFPAKEKFKTMQPDRVRHLLADHKALQKVAFPPFISRLVHI